MTTAGVLYIPQLVEPEHIYYDESGKRLDGVGEVLRGVGIVDMEWASPKALSRGRAVHHACHLLDTVGLDWSTLHPDLHGYVRAWEKCKAETGMEILDSEQRRYHPALRFAGTRDRRVRWNRYTWKLDLKSIGTPNAPGPAWAAEQLGAYDLLEPGDRQRPDKRASILLYPDATWKPEIHHDYNDATYFLSYLTTYRRLKHHGRI